MPDINIAELRIWQRDVAAQSVERDTVAANIVASAAELSVIDAQIADANARGVATTALQKKRARASGTHQENVDALGRVTDTLRDVLNRIALDPGDADPGYPLMLLPVRVETRYTADGTSLRVRIYPDDIHIDALDRGISPEENAAGIAYWTAVWRATDDAAAEAWRTLLAAVGRLRALWVARALQPVNIDQRTTVGAPEFRDVPPRSKRPAVARLLPDAFSATVIQGAQRTTATGRAILPEVTVGLFAPDLATLSSVHGVKVVAGSEWLADYAEAERIGMAITVPLPVASVKVDRLVVYGVRRSIQPKNVPDALTALLESHRCGRGLAFIPQGTPTNNTETDRAGWQRRIEPRAPLRDAVPIDARSNTTVLATALGLDPPAFADVDHADDREQARAQAMNVALWGSSWGSFLDKINRVTKNGATLSDAAREDTRVFHRDYVRGRGPLPAVRVGNQPYGILPVSTTSKWRPDRFEGGLLPILTRLRDKWRQSVSNVPRVGVGPIDKTLLELLGSTPVCAELRVRSVLASEFAFLGGEASGSSESDINLEKILEELIWEDVIGSVELVHPSGSLGEQRPLLLPLAVDGDAAFIDALLADRPPTPTSVFQVLLVLAWDRAGREVIKDSADGRLPEIVRNATTLTAADRERTLAVATRAESTPAATLFTEAARLSASFAASAPTLSEFQPVPALQRSFGELALESTTVSARSELGLYGAYAWLNSQGRLNEIRDAIISLKETALDERLILVAETLDTASHRLDAWITGLVERRRSAQRAAKPVGLTIGAYGWVEDIEPATGRDNHGGFVHAPSLAQAAAAGILRSAYLSHNADAGGDGAFAIDLTSGRVRSALHLIDGVRQGQPLAGLLGYRCERAVHEAKLDRFILSLRKLAPLTQGKLTDRGETVAPGALEILAAGNVLDGIELVEKYQGKIAGWGPAKIREKLNERPTDNPYLVGPWDALTDPEWDKIDAAIRETAAALDATADLLLAESVHQLVAGSSDRAGAALDAASGGDSPPPEPDFIETPVEGMPFTYRILAVAGDAAPWNVSRPRSAAEPRLEAWAAARLGDPSTIVVATTDDGTRVTVAESGQCALDLVYDAADRSAFDQRLRAALPAVAGAVFHDARDPAWAPELRAIGDVFEAAASIRAMMVRSRPAAPSDLTLPNSPPTRAVSEAEMTSAQTRVMTARDLLDVRSRVLDAMLADRVADPEQMRRVLEDLAAFGLVPPLVAAEQLPIVAQSILASAIRRVKDADTALARPLADETIINAGQAVFGEGFWIVPAIDPPDADDGWSAALVAPPAGATATTIRTMLTDYAAIRDGTRRYLEATMLTDAPPARAAQLAGPGKNPPKAWVGGTLSLADPTPDTPVVSTVLDVAGNYDGQSVTAALVIDEWIEVVPIRARRGSADDAPVVERLTTGVTFNAMAPAARAPQAILLAIAADADRWTGETIVEVLEDTMELARLRAVTLERTNGIARIMPALYEQSWSLQGEKVLHLRDTVTQIGSLTGFAAYVKDQP
ncbi:MAG: hypothetical protein ABJF01_04065 [bacterium]